MAGSTYQFLAGLGKKIPQKVLNDEYNRLYRNLVRSVKGYAKRGFDVMFFDIPDKPKKITPGSLKKLQKAVNEWHYYTGRGPVDVSQLGPNVQKTGQMAERNIGSIAGRDIAKKRQQAEATRALIEKNKNNEFYRQAVAEGYDISQLPTDNENLALKLYEIAEEALGVDKGKTGRQQALFAVVNLKAELSIRTFDDMGVLDPTQSKVYSFNLSLVDFETLANAFEAWLWASDQYTDIDTSPLDRVVQAMTTNHDDLPFSAKAAVAESNEYEDI